MAITPLKIRGRRPQPRPKVIPRDMSPSRIDWLERIANRQRERTLSKLLDNVPTLYVRLKASMTHSLRFRSRHSVRLLRAYVENLSQRRQLRAKLRDYNLHDTFKTSMEAES